MGKHKEKKSKKAKLREQYGNPEFSAAGLGTSADPDEYAYRRLTQAASRDLSPLMYERSVWISQYLYEKDPLAHEIVAKPINAIRSAGVNIKADDPITQAYIDDLWGKKNKRGGISKKFFDFYQDARLLGELNLPVSVNPVNGKMTFAFIDPVQIEDVICEPGNALEQDAVKLKRNPAYPDMKLIYKVIRERGETLDGEIFRFALNKPPNAKRGRTALLALLDWVDGLDQALFNDLERWSMLRTFVWDVTLKGMDESKIVAWLQKNFPNGLGPKPGSINAHNEDITWSASTPDLKAADSTAMTQMFRTHIIGGAGYSDWMFGFGQSNQALAREQIAMLVWMIERDQENIADILETIISFGIEQGVRYGRYVKVKEGDEIHVVQMHDGIDRDFTITTPSVFPRDLAILASVLGQTTSATVMAIDNKICGLKTARDMFAYVLNNFMGTEITGADLEREVEEESAEPDLPGLLNGENGAIKNPLLGLPRASNPSFAQVMKMSKRKNGYSKGTRRRLTDSLMD